MIAAIVAADRNLGIGKDGGLLVHLPGDLAYFKRVTDGHTVIMGRKTYESLPNGPLPGRVNIVITSRADYEPPGASDGQPILAHSLEDALALAGDMGDTFIIGGASVYKEALPLCDALYITKIDAAYDADAFFPDADAADSEFELAESYEQITGEAAPYSFTVYKRK